MAYRTGAERPRWATLAAVIAMHAAALVGLAYAFAPDLTRQAAADVQRLISVSLPILPPPAPEPVPQPAPRPQEDAGAAAAPAPRATPRPVAAPSPPIVLPRVVPPAPPVAASGTQDRAGAADAGSGSGGGGTGEGTGSSGAGDGSGGGGGVPVTAPVKIAGEINDARDYPTPHGGREIRQGHHVIVYMVVGTDGRARDCRVVEPSPDPAADRRTCELAERRFRFRPARNAAGEPVEAVFGWRQDWF